jgi:hypothetical protein
MGCLGSHKRLCTMLSFFVSLKLLQSLFIACLMSYSLLFLNLVETTTRAAITVQEAQNNSEKH